VRAPGDCDRLFQLIATGRSDWSRPPLPGDCDQAVDGRDGHRWV